MWDSISSGSYNLRDGRKEPKGDSTGLEGSVAELEQQLNEATGQLQIVKQLVISLSQTYVPIALSVLRDVRGTEIEAWSADCWMSWLGESLEKLYAGAGVDPEEFERTKREAETWYALFIERAGELQECQERLNAAQETIASLEEDLSRVEFWVKDEWEEEAPAPLEDGGIEEPVSGREERPLRFEQVGETLAADESPRFQSQLGIIIFVLGVYDLYRQTTLCEALKIGSAGRATKLFRILVEQGVVDRSTQARLGPGRPVHLLQLTEKGRHLVRKMGEEPSGGVQDLLARHRSPEQALLALKTRDLLESWGYDVDLRPKGFHTPSGRQCRPDLIAQVSADAQNPPSGQVRLFVETEVRPVLSLNYEQRQSRIRKWKIFYEMNEGRLYIVLPDATREDKMLREIVMWQKVTGLNVILYTTNVRTPDSGWQEWRIDEYWNWLPQNRP